MTEYRKFSDGFKTQDQRGTSANPAKLAKDHLTLAALATLAGATPEALQDIGDNFQERAAIMQFDAGLVRAQAEAAALEDCKIVRLSRGERPHTREQEKPMEAENA